MLKRFLEKWSLWEEAFLDIDDLRGDCILSLEKRVARLEAVVAELSSTPGNRERNEIGRAT